ncbi:restriction endonuclease subunit S [Edwardsiella tarda]|uniref:Restriction endonuclease n=1 Tax=Edwardsiella tarda TaxID=636 RepID=A0A2A7U6S7_EDWTA|nr:restriction endonuclease [Edwardsiella tarda]
MKIEYLITEHLDLWTSAVRPKSSAGRGASSKLELTGIKKLRELILELAVRGKLVPQDPSDEPASVLLERIAAEKTRLVADGKIKKPKALPEISEEEKPFELPEGWQWCRLGSLIPQFQNGASSRGDSGGIPITVLRLADIKNWKVSLVDTRTLPIDAKSIDKYSLEKGDILIIRVNGSSDIVGRFIGCDESYNAIYCDHFIRMRFLVEVFDTRYLSLLGSSNIVRSTIADLFISTAGQKTVNQGHISSILLPLPSIAEQQRVVAKVDELMALCDQLEQRSESQLAAHQTLVETLLATLTDSADSDELAQNWARISTHFDTLFTTEASIDALKQTILQLAVMGKLIPQDPSDEPASALLERIAAEKARLVKEKKIKKEKPLPAISEDEVPFALPQGWACCRISDLGYDLGGGTPSKTKSKYWNGNIPWVSPKDMKVDFISSSTDYVTEDAISETVIKLIPSNSLLMVVRGMILAHSFPVALTMAPVAINQDMKALVFSEINEVYLLTLMKAARERVVSMVEHSSHGTCKLVSEKLWSMVVCIPPKEEQLRIIKTVDTLMAICDQLKSRLQTSQQTQLALAESLAEGALA